MLPAPRDVEAELIKARLLARVLGAPPASCMLGRFEVLRCIGRGGMGKVFEARDADTGARLALKTLHDTRDDALEQMKREFRALTTLTHPNLAAMYELHCVQGLPFFTMELVDGRSLSQHLHAGQPVDEPSIHSWLRQLVEVLSAVHARATVHGDIKPSNLLLRADGRLVLVDFGVARALGELRLGPASGTAKYMAPERRRGARAEASSDWYAVGAVLSELLRHAPPQARARFTALAQGLLAPEPRDRYGAHTIRRALGVAAAVGTWFPVGSPEPDPFVGRDAELAALHRAFEATRFEPSRCVVVTGEPGLGKTTLVERFLSSPELAHALVLRGRCYQHELLPYKGFDGIAETLGTVSREHALKVSPELRQVLPALRRTSESGSSATSAFGDGERDPRAVQRKAFAELAALLSAIAQRQRVVLFLDDLQWLDADGAALLEQLLTGPMPPALLWVLTERCGETGPARAALSAASRCGALVTLSLAPLSASACTQLASELSATPLDPAASILQESGGSPLLLRALVRSARVEGRTARTYAELVIATLDDLGLEARRLLAWVVLAGRPVSQELLRLAAGAPEAAWKPLRALHNAGLVRTLTRAGQRSIAAHHDRVAEVVTSMLNDATRRALHLAWAEAAERLALDDPEFLADQYFRGGARAQAAHHFERAGDRARAAVALQRACELYARTLECLSPERPLHQLRKLADAYAAVGDLARAAPLYVEAAMLAQRGSPAHATAPAQLQLKAAEMYLLSGADDTGMKLLRPALREVGIWLPESSLGALALGALAMIRMELALRLRTPAAPRADPRAEIAFRLGYCVAQLHPRHGAALLLWSAARAMRRGSNAQRGTALVHSAYVHALLGLGSRSSQTARVHEALALTQDDRRARAFVLCGDAVLSFARAECRQTLQKCAAASDFIHRERVEERWLLIQLQTIAACVRVMSGDLLELDALAAPLEAEARELGNRAVIVQVQSARAWAALAAGDPSRMQAYAREARATWKAARLSTLYGLAIWGECHRMLYEGDPAGARQLLREEAPAFARSSLAHTQPWSTALTLLWASVELSCSTRAHDARWRAACAWLRRLDRERSAWAGAGSALLRAALARRSGQRGRATKLYEVARDGFTDAGMHGYAAAASYHLAKLNRRASQQAAEVPWFRAQQIAEPTKWVRMYAP